MSRRVQRDPWIDTASKMRADSSARRVYGPLWPHLADVWAMASHTDLTGIATLVALCTDADAVGVSDFLSRLHRPRTGGMESPRSFMAGWVPACQDRSRPLTVDEALVSWVGDDRARRLWAVVGLVWGVSGTDIPTTFEELTGIDARPARLEVPAVAELASAAPSKIPTLLVRDRSLDVVCETYSSAIGVPRGAGVVVAIPAALGAVCAALRADVTEGVAATALLVRAGGIPEVTPSSLVHTTRPGTAARALAELLARLWADSIHDESAQRHTAADT
ncbi:MAG: hypothetical protein KY439_01245 [Actinobacteria bacterium]|nr:hypothetical protein [Actinomycetota bacterium]